MSQALYTPGYERDKEFYRKKKKRKHDVGPRQLKDSC